MQKLLSLVVTLATFISALLGIHNTEDVGGFNKKDWMSRIDGSKYISEISIPGSHDSCALYEPLDNISKCQTYSVKDQLEMGVRFLDIRVFMLFGKDQISHGVILQGQRFRDMVKTCLDFLEENPDETILFSVKEEQVVLSEQNVADLIAEIISEDESKWFTENRIPTLDEVRGKIVLVNRYSSYQYKGLMATAFDGWENNMSFDITHWYYTIHVQDHYEMKNEQDIEEKWNEAKALFDMCREEAYWQGNLYINFLSGNIGLIPNITKVSDFMNVRFEEYVKETGKGSYGIVVADYVTTELCEQIIETN
ncbi:MAG: phosphatidylinositol-specific phospholipase C [Clostridia bacterium]|nr:phosphatidylinositol-specific phospholipase C [Clostridia bacterium]